MPCQMSISGHDKNNNYIYIYIYVCMYICIYVYIYIYKHKFSDIGQQEVQATILFEKESKARALIYFLEILGNRKWR